MSIAPNQVIDKISRIVDISACKPSPASPHKSCVIAGHGGGCGGGSATGLTCTPNPNNAICCNGDAFNSPGLAVWTGGVIANNIPGFSPPFSKQQLTLFFTNIQDNNIKQAISDDILWWCLSRNLAYSAGFDQSVVSTSLAITTAFQDTYDETCGGGVVWGCLGAGGGWHEDAQKNAVTNLLVLLSTLQLISLQQANNPEHISFARKIWSWLKLASSTKSRPFAGISKFYADVAGLVDYKNGIVYDNFKPVQSDGSENPCRPYGCYVAKYPGSDNPYFPGNLGNKCVQAQTELCSVDKTYNDDTWPTSWETNTPQINQNKHWYYPCPSTNEAAGNCNANTTYNQGLLIGCMVQMHILKNKFNIDVDVDSNFDYIGLAVKAFTVTVDGTLKDVEGTPLGQTKGKFPYILHEYITTTCEDNHWFRSIFFWYSINLYTILKTTKLDSAAVLVKNTINSNWNYHSQNSIISKTGDTQYLTRTPPPPLQTVGCFKDQIDMLWLAIAYEYINNNDPKNSETLLTYSLTAPTPPGPLPPPPTPPPPPSGPGSSPGPTPSGPPSPSTTPPQPPPQPTPPPPPLKTSHIAVIIFASVAILFLILILVHTFLL
jgi:hypothetical protein